MFKTIRNFIARPRHAAGTYTVETDSSWHVISTTDWDAPVRVFAKPVPDQPTAVEADPWDGLRPDPMFCDQCGRETSWTTNAHAKVAGHMICSHCDRRNADAEAAAPVIGVNYCPSRDLRCPCMVHQKAREKAAALLWD